MADTLGGVIDKLITIDTKLWLAQDQIYAVRKMTFEEYKEAFFKTEDGAEKLWGYIKAGTDLNLQRSQLVDEIDEKIIEMIDAKMSGENLDEGKFVQRKHKTY